jgi:hypothetical protein
MRRTDHMRASPPALIAIASLATAAACGPSPSKPAAQAAQPEATKPTTQAVTTTPKSFMSRRYSFRVVLTKDWSEQDALVDWNGRKLQRLGSAGFANFTDLTTRRTLVAGAAPIANEWVWPNGGRHGSCRTFRLLRVLVGRGDGARR